MARRIPTVLTDEELAALYGKINEATATGKRDRALLQVMADAGLRVSEALALRTQDLRRENGRITAITVHAGKGDNDRAVYTTPQLSDKILRWLDARAGLGVGKGLVFCRIKGGAGQPLGVRTVQGLVEHLALEAGIEKRVSPHTLRHTSATRTLRATGNLRIVQDNLGHARLETTRIYTHIQDAERQAAAEALPPVDGDGAASEVDPLAQIAGALAGLPKEAREKLAEALKA